jgi:hypothetical protein
MTEKLAELFDESVTPLAPMQPMRPPRRHSLATLPARR